MTNQDQNAAIAKWMGWNPTKDFVEYMWAPGHITPVQAKWKRGLDYLVETPNYCGDLNLIFEAESKLTRDQFIDYVDSWLCCAVADKPGNVCSDDTGWAPAMVHANAAIKAECLLRTLNLWTD